MLSIVSVRPVFVTIPLPFWVRIGIYLTFYFVLKSVPAPARPADIPRLLPALHDHALVQSVILLQSRNTSPRASSTLVVVHALPSPDETFRLFTILPFFCFARGHNGCCLPIQCAEVRSSVDGTA